MADEIDALIEDVIVDAYGDGEQLSSFCQWFEETATFPFQATVVGAVVEVIEIDYDGDDRRGLVAQCRRDGQNYAVSLLDIVPTVAVPTETANLFAAYRRWANAVPLEGRMMARRRSVPSTPNLDRLDHDERSFLMVKLLAAHQELLAEAEQRATELLTDMDASAIADAVAAAMMELEIEEVGNRSGRYRGGYTEPTAAAWEIVHEAFEPFLADLRKLAELGHISAASTMAQGLVDGLDELGDVADDTVLAWAGDHALTELVEAVYLEVQRLGLYPPEVE